MPVYLLDRPIYLTVPMIQQQVFFDVLSVE